MLKNVWEKIKLYCLNHDEPIEMSILSNTEYIKTPFYACSNYVKAPGQEGETCPNRLNIDDYYKIVEQFLEAVEKNPMGNFLNYTFVSKKTHQSIKVKVIKYADDEIRLGIINQTVFGKR